MISLAAVPSASSSTLPWTNAQDGNLGFHFSYPRDLLQKTPQNEKPSFHYFVSREGEAKFMVGAWDNIAGQTPD